jgi:hypothetical protein
VPAERAQIDRPRCLRGAGRDINRLDARAGGEKTPGPHCIWRSFATSSAVMVDGFAPKRAVT